MENADQQRADGLDGFPVKHCQSRYCPNYGPFTDERIIYVGSPVELVIAYCLVCDRKICLGCALQVQASEEEFWALDEASELKQLCIRFGTYPIGFRCRHCGELLGQDGEPLILIDSELRGDSSVL